ncbi:MAG: S8 family serine peptidase [Acidimicrobiia bacterium]
MKRTLVLFVAFATALALAMPLAQAEEADTGEFNQNTPVEEGQFDSYIVVMDEDPLTATMDQEDLGSSTAEAEAEQLKESHDDVMQEEGLDTGDKVHDYVNALNGFSALLTHDEAERLASNPKVARVVPDELQQATTDSSPEFIGIDGRRAETSAWAAGYTGKGVVVGIIDTGVWPEHPSFADNGMPAPPAGVPADLPCEFGNPTHRPLEDVAFDCSNKLLGARQVLDTYRTLIGADPDEFDSARDDNGHGTHTASTAAGDKDVEAYAFGEPVGKISGIAYDAHIIAYKALGKLGGFTSDLAAGIDQAVADGVDVINYSIGGGASLTGGDDIAFLFAADAGVWVATSAGNSGPGPATVGGPGTVPWITTVGANTQSRFFQGEVKIRVERDVHKSFEFTSDSRHSYGFGWFGWFRDWWRGIRYKTYTFEGASLTPGSDWAPLVDGADAGDEQCNIGALDPAVVTGAIVLCKRGVLAADPGREEKGRAVQEAGGVGMVLYNVNDVDNLFTDPQRVPTVHVDGTPGLEIKDLIASGKVAEAKIVTGDVTKWKSAPSMTIFSSRGPNPVAPDIIKPDVTAPGMQILAGNSPNNNTHGAQGEWFQSIAGTSMSSPHVAGLFALLKQAHPDWTPAMAKSALMTTADQDVRDNDRSSQAGTFAMGSGQVDPGGKGAGSAFNPGLVYDAGFNEYLGFLCDADPTVFANPSATCSSLEAAGSPTDASDLNLSSIGVGELAGSQTVTRTVTSVASRTLRYRVSVHEPAGYDVKVEPSSFRIRPGESVSYTVTFTNESAPIGEWRTGSLEWRSGDYDVYSPIAVNAALFDAPDEVETTGVDGSASFDVTFGYTGAYAAEAHGLEPAMVTTDAVAQDPDQNFDPDDGFSNAYTFDLAGAAYFRVAVPPIPDDPDVDIDVYVYDPTGAPAGSSTLGGTDEEVNFVNPADGTWTVYVHGWQTVDGSADFTMYAWQISATPGGNMTVTAPTSATLGGVEPIVVDWTGAAAGGWHLGAVSHSGDAGPMGLTIINVDNR